MTILFWKILEKAKAGQVSRKGNFDRIKLNRWFLQHNGTLYPWEFVSTSTGCHHAISSRKIIRSLTFNIQLTFCILYAVYIQCSGRWLSTHAFMELTQGAILYLECTLFEAPLPWPSHTGVTSSLWHTIIYNFVQLSPGKIKFFKKLTQMEKHYKVVLKLHEIVRPAT